MVKTRLSRNFFFVKENATPPIPRRVTRLRRVLRTHSKPYLSSRRLLRVADMLSLIHI